VLHNSEKVAASSMVMFFCRKDIRSYLEAHPALLSELLTRMGSVAVFKFYEQ
jgi:hypothetical protein